MAKKTLTQKIFAPAEHGYPGFTLRCDTERTLKGLAQLWDKIVENPKALAALNRDAGLQKGTGLDRVQLASVAQLLLSMAEEVEGDTAKYTDSLPHD